MYSVRKLEFSNRTLNPYVFDRPARLASLENWNYKHPNMQATILFLSVIQHDCEKMDSRTGGENATRERARRPVRNKRYTRRVFGDDRRPQKRLFTPEIKRFLKDWLVRRRENPYPNRDEKKMLAVQTGLTYIQVCNWFANWRRKLKNAGKEPQRKTWGDLIKSYNNQVQGNVEHFSICSDDSIWGESESYDRADHNYTNGSGIAENQCYLITSTTDNNPFSQKNYRNHIMDTYLNKMSDESNEETTMVSKWLESAVNFKPNENNYLHWTLGRHQNKNKKNNAARNAFQVHGREELDAAEALTTLAASKSFKH